MFRISGDRMRKQLDKNLLIHNLSVRMASLGHLINRDTNGNTQGFLEAWREVKYWKEAIERSEYDIKDEPSQKKEDLIKRFKEKKQPEKLMTVKELGLNIDHNTFDYFRSNENYKEPYLELKDKFQKVEQFLLNMRKHYDDIAKSDHPLIEAANPLAGIEDFLVDELGWVGDEE